jgi:hypothetical protein
MVLRIEAQHYNTTTIKNIILSDTCSVATMVAEYVDFLRGVGFAPNMDDTLNDLYEMGAGGGIPDGYNGI